MQRRSLLEGKVRIRALEYHVVDHCNLRCDHCCSYSPILKKWFADTGTFERDLKAMSRVVAPEFFKIVGGEPLLHPELERQLVIARSLAVAPLVQLTTNGFLMRRLTSRAWACLDILTVSLYPEPALPKELIRFIAHEAAARNVRVSWKIQDKFSLLDRAEIARYEDAKRVFERCWIRQRCNSIKQGRFYCCTRPQYVQRFAPDPAIFLEDGVEVAGLDETALARRIEEHLGRSEPLHSCFLCQGGYAPLDTNRQLTAIEAGRKRERLRGLADQLAAITC
jgi:organic radical activating enzyme